MENATPRHPASPNRLSIAALALLLAGTTVSLAREGDAYALSPDDHSRQYVDAQGRPLPFADDDQILQFLSTADIVEERTVSKGINKILKLTLEKQGLRVYAAFRSVDISRPRHRLPDGRVAANAKDSYRYDPAAYWVSRLLGLDAVPPAVLRRHRGKRGSLQLWIGNVIDEQDRRAQDLSPHAVLWFEQTTNRLLFDNLIANYDRNQTNILMDPETWRVWWIDHGRSFLVDDRLLEPDHVTGCSREVLERLRTLDEKVARERLDEFLDRYEIKTLLERKDAIVERVESRIAERGAAAVLFHE